LKQVPIWPAMPPDAQPVAGPEEVKPDACIENVSVPTMTVYPAKGKNTGVAVIVFPGGGYQILAIGIEGTEVCEWLASQGITAVLLKYRVPYSGPHYNQKLKRHEEAKAPNALQDAQRTIGLVRLHAAEWGINPHKVGVLGFSAGGHLVADTATHFDQRAYPPIDAADKESCRPDFGVALYPGHMLENTKNDFELNPKVPVTKNTPPIFILQAENDPVDEVQNSLVLYMALKNAKVPVEMHLYAEGGHAFGLRPTKFPITKWPALVETWLRTIGMIPAE
jgi:acetyl esterase/lipase